MLPMARSTSASCFASVISTSKVLTAPVLSCDVRVQTERVMENLAAVLEAAGCSFADVVKASIFVADLGDFAAVNEVYGKRFPKDPPARSTVQVAALPRGSRVEIDLIAVKR
jgi:2-iminobutanoate/2-iminopropanoate deaminase